MYTDIKGEGQNQDNKFFPTQDLLGTNIIIIIIIFENRMA